MESYAMNNHFWLASQNQWADNIGFYVSLENSSATDEVRCPIDTLNLVFAVADGRQWRYLKHTGPWQIDRKYSVKARISQGIIELLVDDTSVSRAEGEFFPAEGKLVVNSILHWYNAPTEYLVVQDSFAISSGRRKHSISFADQASKPLPVFLFEPQCPTKLEWKSDPQEELEVKVEFHLIRNPDANEFAPFIDRYGQFIHANWKGKISSDEQLREDIAEEDKALRRMPPSEDYDEYGGYKRAGWKEDGTGFFRTVRRDGFWWLITPLGNPCFYLGVNTLAGQTWPAEPVTGREFLFEWLPPKESPWVGTWLKGCYGVSPETEYVCFHGCNLIRKYGDVLPHSGLSAEGAKKEKNSKNTSQYLRIEALRAGG